MKITKLAKKQWATWQYLRSYGGAGLAAFLLLFEMGRPWPGVFAISAIAFWLAGAISIRHLFKQEHKKEMAKPICPAIPAPPGKRRFRIVRDTWLEEIDENEQIKTPESLTDLDPDERGQIEAVGQRLFGISDQLP